MLGVKDFGAGCRDVGISGRYWYIARGIGFGFGFGVDIDGVEERDVW
jgi:hypothetical protein